MRLSLRFVLPLIAVIALVAYLVVPLVDDLMLAWVTRDLDIRARLVASTLQEPLAERLSDDVREPTRATRIVQLLERTAQDERLFAIAWCDTAGRKAYRSAAFPPEIPCERPGAGAAPPGRIVRLASGPLHVAAAPVVPLAAEAGVLMILHDMSFADRRSAETRRYLIVFFAGLGLVIALLTIVIAELSWRGWVASISALIRGQSLAVPPQPGSKALSPIARDLADLVRELETERRIRDESQMSWVPDTLRGILRDDLHGHEILIVSNREPYIHVRRAGAIEVLRPASGLVTALEPVMRACSGTWIAHGAGNADRDTVDAHDRVAVPPDHPAYRIRRIWLTPEEEAGYYYGFANEGLWPLCHIAHTRPVFRAADWEHYRVVNRRFADAVVAESRTRDPIVLVQDYHFALLPRMLRERLPDATIITFWHIPWPNPEAFGLCPWREELLDGMLGSSILGFHTQFHCNNFFDTADRFLEARVDRETFTISLRGEPTEVRRYPISIEWPPEALAGQPAVADCRAAVIAEEGLAPDAIIGIGVDRLDYTKGILERFAAIERLLEREPAWAGRLAFIQVAAPSRSGIAEYQDLESRVRAEAARINRRFARDGRDPILLKVEHHDGRSVYRYYRASDFCFVSSLHDGMNLVAKEFIASRDDERGVLVLSQFAGAARELTEALVVNPYDTEQCATALHAAISMSPQEQRARMRGMRALVQEFNVYRWAGRMLLDAARMRRRRHLTRAQRADSERIGRSA